MVLGAIGVGMPLTVGSVAAIGEDGRTLPSVDATPPVGVGESVTAPATELKTGNVLIPVDMVIPASATLPTILSNIARLVALRAFRFVTIRLAIGDIISACVATRPLTAFVSGRYTGFSSASCLSTLAAIAVAIVSAIASSTLSVASTLVATSNAVGSPELSPMIP